MSVRRQRGFTLLEVIAAVVIIAVGVVGVLGAYALAMRGVGDEGEAVRATALGQAAMETLLELRDRGELDGNDEENACDDLFDPADLADGTGFTLEYRCPTDEDGAYEGWIPIIVTVTNERGSQYVFVHRVHEP